MTQGTIREFLTGEEWRRRHLSGRPSKIANDAELRQFVDAALERMTFEAIAAACRERFGWERAPSKSAVHRYWLTYRSPAATRPIEKVEIWPRSGDRGGVATPTPPKRRSTNLKGV